MCKGKIQSLKAVKTTDLHIVQINIIENPPPPFKKKKKKHSQFTIIKQPHYVLIIHNVQGTEHTPWV